MMAMALGDGAVENDRLIVMVYFVIDAVRKIRSSHGAVKTLYDHAAFQDCGLLRIIAPRGSGLRPNPSRQFARWQFNWNEIWNDLERRASPAEQAGAWSEKILHRSGLLNS